jgi:hypothetical protein
MYANILNTQLMRDVNTTRGLELDPYHEHV